jgi:hypothetical protein
MMKRILGGIGLVALAACASSAPRPPMRPYMSAAGHETTAATLEERARKQEGRFDPNARLNNGMCRGRPRSNNGDDVCWTSLVNPTDQHLKHAAEHRRLAADHRAAAKTLRDAEMRACSGIADDDRDESPFNHKEDILRVEPLRGGVTRYLNEPWTEGVVVTFREVPGMTAEWLQHVVDCQLARNAALGNDVPQEPTCLLVPKGVRASVAAVPDGFAVTVRAGDNTTAEELFRRADALNVTTVRRNSEEAQPAAPAQPAQPATTQPATAPQPPPPEGGVQPN